MLIIGPDPFFQYWPGCPNGPKTEILHHQKLLNAKLGIYIEWDLQFICKTGCGLCLEYSKLTTLTTSWNYQAWLLDIVFLLPASQLWKGLFLLWNYALEIVIHELFDVQFEGWVLYICHELKRKFPIPNQSEPSRKQYQIQVFQFLRRQKQAGNLDK